MRACRCDRAKRYLRQIGKLRVQIENLEADIKALREDVKVLRAAWPDGQPRGSGVGDPVGEAAAELADRLDGLEYEMLQKQSELWRQRMEVAEVIEAVTMQDAVCGKILHLRYVDGMQWEQICVEISYSWRQTHRHHAEALAMVEAMLIDGVE